MLLHRLLALGLCASLAAPALAQTAARKDLLGDLLPEGAVSRMGSGRLRSATGITCLSFTPDGKSLVSGGQGNKLTFWSVATGRVEKEWTLGTSIYVTDIRFDKAGKTMALSSNDGSVRILDGATGAERRQMVDPNRRWGTVYGDLSPDGKWLVVNNRDYSQISVYSVDSGVLQHSIPNVRAYNRATVLFTPDNKHFVSPWTDNKIHLVDLATGKSVRCLETSSGTSNSAYDTMTLSAGGKQLVYRSYSDRHFHVVDVADGKEVKKFEPGNGSYYSQGSVALTPNGRFIVESGGDASVRVWGIASGKMLREFSAPNTSLASAIVSPDGKLVAAAYNTSIYLWGIASGKLLHGGSGHASAVSRVAFTPNGKYLVSTGSNSTRVWESATGKELFVTRLTDRGPITNDFHVTPDNKSIRWIGYDRAIYRWQFATDRDPVKLTTPKIINGSFTLQVTSPDGKLVAVVNNTDRKVRLLDNVGDAPDRLLGVLPSEYSNAVYFSPDGRTLALASSDRSVTLYDVATGNETRKLMPDPTNATYHGNFLHFSPDGRTLLKYDGEMRVVETISGSDRALLSREPAGAPGSMSCSSDGRLVARGFADGTVVVTDVWTGREVLRRETGQGSLTSLCMNRDGKYLATGGTNTTAVVWELAAVEKPSRLGPMTDEVAWGDLEDSDAGRAHRAMLHMIAAPDETVRLFANRLKPRRPVDAERIAKLVANLDDDDYRVRERATDELLEVGMLAVAPLEKAARSTSLEVKRRARDLLRRIRPGTSVAPERLRAQRAVEVLERIGTPAARAVLEAMLKSRLDTPLEVSIKQSLDRLRATG